MYAGDVASVRARLRRRILLRLRESAKIIVPGAELAFGSNSSPWHNNADSRSPSSITPPPQQPEPMPHPRLKLQPQGTEADGRPVLNCERVAVLAERIIFNTEAYSNQIGTAFHIQYRSIHKSASKNSTVNKATGRILLAAHRHSVPHPIPKNTRTISAQHLTSNTEACRQKSTPFRPPQPSTP